MNYLELGMIVLTILPIVVGFLIGLIRGIKRSVARAITIVVCVVLAGVLCGVLTGVLMDLEVPGEGVTVEVMLRDTLSEMMGEMDLDDIIVPFAKGLVQLIVFILVFWVLQFLTWIIVTPICAAIFGSGEKKKDPRPKKHRLFGGLIGAVQGFAIALVVCMIFSGLFVQVGTVSTLAKKLPNGGGETTTETTGGETTTETTGGVADEMLDMLSAYKDTGVAKFYEAVTGAPFKWLSSVKTEDGETQTVSGLVGALSGAVEMVQEMDGFEDLHFDEMFESGDFSKLREIFVKLDKIKENMDNDSVKTLDRVLKAAGDAIADTGDIGLDFSNMDFASINFTHEANIIEDIYDYKKDFDSMTVAEGKQAAREVVSMLADSKLLVPLVAGADVDIPEQIGYNAADKVLDAIDELEGEGELDAEMADTLRDIFGF